MIRRNLELLALILLGGLGAVFGLDNVWGVVLGCLLGAVAWITIDNIRAAKVFEWLRHGNGVPPPNVAGGWDDVVERARKSFKILNRKARKSEVRLQEFLSALLTLPNGVLLLGKNDCIEWCNFAAAQHLGFDAKRDLYQQVRHLVRDPSFIALLNQEDASEPIEIDGKDAAPGQPQRITINVHNYGKGRRLILSRDVTALQQAEAMRREFVANVSHEIRTPLTVVSGFIETLLNLDLTEDEQKRYLELMDGQTQRMQSLVSDLLTLSRLEGSPMPGATEWESAQALLEQAMSEARALSDVLSGGRHSLVIGGAPEFDVAVSRSELVSAMTNLLNNAIRHTPPESTVRAGWRLTAEGGAEFYVEDNGPGIAPEHLARLTERFYRVDRSRSRETGGTGLGLAIVKHVAQRHGGQIAVHSTVGKGSVFMLALPPSRVLAD